MNNLLEKLDGTVEDAVQKSDYDCNDIAVDEYYSGEIVGVSGQSSVDDILAKRGLLDDDDKDPEAMEELTQEDGEYSSDTTPNNDWDKGTFENLDKEKTPEPSNPPKASIQKGKLDVSSVSLNSALSDDSKSQAVSSNITNDDPKKETDNKISKKEISDDQKDESNNKENETVHNDIDENVDTQTMNSSKDGNEEKKIENSTETVESQSNTPPLNQQPSKNYHTASEKSENVSEEESSRNVLVSETNKSDEIIKDQKKLLLKSKEETKQASIEIRKLRRHVIKLNAQLESTEREMDAQRVELDRAAARMEKDRLRNKEEKERIIKGHKDDIKNILEEHKAAIKSMVESHEAQLADREEWITRTEEARVQEGGDLNKELQEAADRESELRAKITLLEDEKTTRSLQYASHQTQMSSLQSRLEAVTEAEELAKERERDADNRLDAALSLHARQLSQRQTRETELERAVADLGAALVLTRRNEQNHSDSKEMQSKKELTAKSIENEQKLSRVEEELDNVKTSLSMEKQRCESLQLELEDFSKERIEEYSSFDAKQKQHDRQVADLKSTIKSLQANLRGKSSSDTSKGDKSSEPRQNREKHFEEQISKLTKELFNERRKFENSASEASTLRNRLGTALRRATNAEEALQKAPMEQDDLEFNLVGKRRGFGQVKNKMVVPSIRSAIKCEPGRGEIKETIGLVVDAIDHWAVDLGSFLRKNPLARFIFLIYTVVIHMWAFFILFHISNLVSSQFNHETIHSDVHGPHSMLKHSYRHMEQVKG